MHEEGKLKGQKQRKMTQANMKKASDGQFSAKLFHFKPFQGLEVSVIVCVYTHHNPRVGVRTYARSNPENCIFWPEESTKYMYLCLVVPEIQAET